MGVFFQAEDGILYFCQSRWLDDVYKRQAVNAASFFILLLIFVYIKLRKGRCYV